MAARFAMAFALTRARLGDSHLKLGALNPAAETKDHVATHSQGELSRDSGRQETPSLRWLARLLHYPSRHVPRILFYHRFGEGPGSISAGGFERHIGHGLAIRANAERWPVSILHRRKKLAAVRLFHKYSRKIRLAKSQKRISSSNILHCTASARSAGNVTSRWTFLIGEFHARNLCPEQNLCQQ